MVGCLHCGLLEVSFLSTVLLMNVFACYFQTFSEVHSYADISDWCQINAKYTLRDALTADFVVTTSMPAVQEMHNFYTLCCLHKRVSVPFTK